MRAEVRKKAREDHYPAPYRLIDLFERYGGNDEAMKAAETRAFAPLMASDQSRNLRRVFWLSELLKGQAPEEARLAPEPRARHRRRHHGRGHRRLVRRLRHGGDAAGRLRRADRQRHRRAGQAVRAQVQDQGAARCGQGAPHRRSQRRLYPPRRRRHRGDRREPRDQAEGAGRGRGQDEVGRRAGDQHLLAADRGYRRRAARSGAPHRPALLQSGGADAAGRGGARRAVARRRREARRRLRRCHRQVPAHHQERARASSSTAC